MAELSANAELFEKLLEKGRIDLRRGRLLDAPPAPLPSGLDWDRVDGMMLGLAIGDALGRPTEAMNPARRFAAHGEVRDYLPSRRSGETALPSDDSQMAFWTLDQMLLDDGLVPENVAHRFGSEHIFGIGSAVREALLCLELVGLPWYECGSHSAGNGALMRIAPVLVPSVRSPAPSADLWADTALLAITTHNDATSTSACLAWVAMLWDLLGRTEAPEPHWWPRRYVQLARDLEGEKRLRPRGGDFPDFCGPLWQFVEESVPGAYDAGLTSLEACDSWYSGAYLLETVPCVLSILMRHAGDPEEALVRAVNDTRDNDTVAAIVGAAVGALHGAQALPERWRTDLKGRTRAADDGEVQRILARARRRWG